MASCSTGGRNWAQSLKFREQHHQLQPGDQTHKQQNRHSTVWVGWLLNHPCLLLHTLQRIRPPSTLAPLSHSACPSLFPGQGGLAQEAPILTQSPPCCLALFPLLATVFPRVIFSISGVLLGTDMQPLGPPAAAAEILEVSRDSPPYHHQWLPCHKAGQPFP